MGNHACSGKGKPLDNSPGQRLTLKNIEAGAPDSVTPLNPYFHAIEELIMQVVLGSWKEIANYLGKGVRTVQRWERCSGLPVHRPSGSSKGVVLAFPAELDKWARRQDGMRHFPAP